MQFPYECQKCHKRQEQAYGIGKAPRTVSCSCGGIAKRIYETTGLVFMVGGNPIRKSTFGESLKKRNMNASSKLHGKKPPVRVTAYDYGNGDIRDVK